MTIEDIITAQIAEYSLAIQSVKREATTRIEKKGYRFFSPDGKSSMVYNGKVPTGWTYTRGIYYITKSISPKSLQWHLYRFYKRRTTVLLAAKLILKHEGAIPQANYLKTLVVLGVFRSQAGTIRQQRRLAFAAYKLLSKVEKRFSKYGVSDFQKEAEWHQERGLTLGAVSAA